MDNTIKTVEKRQGLTANNYKINGTQEAEILGYLVDNWKQVDLARKYNVSPQCISVIAKKNDDKLQELKELKNQITLRYLKNKALDKAKELLNSITQTKITKANLSSIVLSAKELIELCYPKNSAKIQIDFNFNELIKKAQNNDTVIDITPQPTSKKTTDNKKTTHIEAIIDTKKTNGNT